MKKKMLAKNGVKNMHFLAFLGNQTIDFSDFRYVTSLIYYFKYGIRQFCKKNVFWAKNGEKGVKNMRFRARISNQSTDFSNFWYKTSLIYYFKDCIRQFCKKRFFGPKMVIKM